MAVRSQSAARRVLVTVIMVLAGFVMLIPLF